MPATYSCAPKSQHSTQEIEECITRNVEEADVAEQEWRREQHTLA
jgi:hypothetical protein